MTRYKMIHKVFKKLPAFFDYGFNRKTLEDIIDLSFKYNNLIINTQDNHYKFWAYVIKGEEEVEYTWGRIGSEGTSLTKLDTPWQANSKRINKVLKGYYTEIEWDF